MEDSWGGDVGAKVGVAAATLVLGSVGGVPLAIGIAVCAVAGAYLGATSGSDVGKKVLSIVYQFMHDVVDSDGGFFDWTAEQI